MLKATNNKHIGNGGFTLAELMIVIVIIGILVAIAVPTFLGQRTKAVRSEAMTNLEALRLLQEQFFAENATYTGSAGTCAKGNPDNIDAIKALLPGFKPGTKEDLYFSYCLITNVTIDGTDTTGVASPYDCFTAKAYGNSGTPVNDHVLMVDCNNEKDF